MPKLLADYIIDPRTRYESHRLIYTPENAEPIEFGGFLAAAILTTAVYAMRQLGYIRRKCSDKDMRQWLSEHLKLNYSERNNASQFQRAMKEHGRFTPEVQDEVMLLESMGYFRFQPSADPDISD